MCIKENNFIVTSKSKLYLFWRTMTKNSIRIHLMILSFRFFGIVELQSHNGIFKFNIADQKLKNRTVFKFLICYIESAIRTLKVLFSNLDSVSPETLSYLSLSKHTFSIFDLLYWIRHFEFWNSSIIFGVSDPKNLRRPIIIKSGWCPIKFISGSEKRLQLWQASVRTKIQNV